jgi:PAS domain S-box-containing protein
VAHGLFGDRYPFGRPCVWDLYVLQRSLEARTKDELTNRGWSIPTYLIALAIASTLPIAIVAGVLAYHVVSESSQRARLELEERLTLLRSALELRVTNVIEDLQVLARSPSLQDGNLAEFRRHAVETADLIGGIGLVLVDHDGQQVVSTRLPPGAPLPRRRELETLKRVLATASPQVSDLVPAAADGQPIISVEVPVQVAGSVPYVLAVGLSPKYLSDLMDQYVPDGAIGSIIDRKGILITRRPLLDGLELVGKPTIPEVRAHIGQPAALWIETMSRSGVPSYSSFLRSELTGWSVNLALARNVVDGPLRRTALLFTALAAGAFLLSLIWARLIASRFLRALTGLEYHVIQAAHGRVIRPAPGPVAEVNRMEDALHRVARDVAAAEESVERERSLLKATVESMPIGVLLVAPDGTVSLVNRKILSLWGVDDARSLEDLGKLTRFRTDGTPYPLSEWPITRALERGQVTENEEVVHEVDGTRRHMMISATPVRDGAGRMIAAVAACYDVTDLRTAMTRQQILLDEINHRVRNTLATVQSVARLTLSSSDSLQDYANSFEQRIVALSSAYNLLTDNNWEGADLRAIVERTLAPFARDGRTSMSGPPVTLTPRFTLALAAAVQELSTNAAKYGALSVQTGCVDVAWSIENDGSILFTWAERDGPPVTKPTRRGFGTKLIQDMLASDAGWTVTLDYLPTGLRCTMIIDAGATTRLH